MRIAISRARWLLAIACLTVAGGTNGQEHVRPGNVFALVIAVGNDRARRLDFARPIAEKFGSAVKKTYEHAQVEYLFDENATQARVREFLFKVIPQRPTYGLSIVYFIGHGESLAFPHNSQPGTDSYLLLHGATQENYLGNSIRTSEIADSFVRSGRTNAMAIIDACASGSTIFAPGRDDDLGVKAFMLAASSSGGVAQGGKFTEAVLDEWEKARLQRHTLTPAALEETLRARLRVDMTPKLVFGRQLGLSTIALDGPSYLLLLRFQRKCTEPAQVYFNNASEFMTVDFNNMLEPLVVPRQLPRPGAQGQPATQIRIQIQGEDVVPHFEIPATDIKNDVHIHTVIPTKYVAAGLTPSEHANGAYRVATLIDMYGSKSAEFYLESARAYNAAGAASQSLGALEMAITRRDGLAPTTSVAAALVLDRLRGGAVLAERSEVDRRPFATDLIKEMRDLPCSRARSELELFLADGASDDDARLRHLSFALANYDALNDEAGVAKAVSRSSNPRVRAILTSLRARLKARPHSRGAISAEGWQEIELFVAKELRRGTEERGARLAVVVDRGVFERVTALGSQMSGRDRTTVLNASDPEVVTKVNNELRADGDALIGVGPAAAELVAGIARERPRVKCVLIDAVPPERSISENLVTIRFDEREVGFLAGALARAVSRNGRLGYVGDLRTREGETTLDAFRRGAARRGGEPSVSASHRAGMDSADATSKILAERWVSEGIDTVYCAHPDADGSLSKALSERGVMLVGTTWEPELPKSAHAVTAVYKSLREAVRPAYDYVTGGKRPAGGSLRLGVADGAVGYCKTGRLREREVNIVELDALMKELQHGKIELPGKRARDAMEPLPRPPEVRDPKETNPDYAELSVGDKFIFEQVAGEQKLRVVHTVTEKTAEKAVVSVVTELPGVEMPPVKVEIPATGQRGSVAAAGGSPEGKPIGEDVVTVSGIDYKCKILEFSAGGATWRTWRADRYPYAVKTSDDKGRVLSELVRVVQTKKWR